MELRDPRKQEVIYGVAYDMPPSPGRKHALRQYFQQAQEQL